MKVLAIETSSTACSVAVISGDRLLAETFLDVSRTLSERLLKGVDAVLSESEIPIEELDGIGVSIGPGSFTGLRVGVATAKGLALAADKPIVGFSSLACLAMNLPYASLPVCPMLDARKNEIYTALYRCTDSPSCILTERVIDPSAFLEELKEPTLFIGEGSRRYRDLIVTSLGSNAIFPPPPFHSPRASVGATLAVSALARGEAVPLVSLNPVYIRPSEAEIAKMKREL